MADIETMTIPEIYEHLCARFPDGLVLAYADNGNEDDPDHGVRVAAHGRPTTLLGIVRFIERDVDAFAFEGD